MTAVPPPQDGHLYALGFCLKCLAAYKDGGPYPEPAITLVPAPAPIPGPDGAAIGMGIASIPVCWGHFTARTAQRTLLSPHGT